MAFNTAVRKQKWVQTEVTVNNHVSLVLLTPPGHTSSSPPLPLLMWYHGGGFCVGAARDNYIADNLHRFQNEAIVASVEYRLAPRDPFPAAADDTTAALDYVHSHAKELGTAKDMISVAGSSAGGNLAAVALHHAAQQKIPLRHAALFVPLFHNNCARSIHTSVQMSSNIVALPLALLFFFFNSYAQKPSDSDDPRCSPILATDKTVSSIPCPVLTVTCSADPLRDSGILYVERLQAACKEVTHVMLRGSHSFGMTADLAGMKEAAGEWKKGVLGKRG